MKTTLIIPTYNRASYLKEALESVLSQTVIPSEIIVIDDGSDDETSEVVKNFQNVNPVRKGGALNPTALSIRNLIHSSSQPPQGAGLSNGINYIFQKNQGVSSARNRGIEASSGDWIMFLDSDDRWYPEKVETQLQELDTHRETLISYTDEIWIRNGRRVNPKNRHAKYSGWIFDSCLPLCIISPSSVMIHRSIFKEVGHFDENLPACEDYDLWLRIALHYPIHFIQKPLIEKRGGHSDQLSKRYFGMDRFRVQALKKLLRDSALTPNLKTKVIEEIKKKSMIYAQGCLKRNRIEEYEKYQERLEGDV